MKLLGGVFSILVVLAFTLTGVSYGSEGEVTIKRDNFGVGHVYADTVYGVYYGYGYAVAQDRLFQMEMAKRSTQGKVAEVLGEKHVEFDKRIRGNYNPISIQRQLDSLSESDADIFRGYAAGMNAWIEEVKKNADRLMPFIEKAAQASTDEKLKAATGILLQWNQSSRDKDKDGNYDQPATAIFRTFLPEMIKFRWRTI